MTRSSHLIKIARISYFSPPTKDCGRQGCRDCCSLCSEEEKDGAMQTQPAIPGTPWGLGSCATAGETPARVKTLYKLPIIL